MATSIDTVEAKILKENFDIDAYEESLELASIRLPGGMSAFKHYLGAGCCLGLTPSVDYCEASYLLRYPDIAKAIAHRKIRNGYVHYLRHGKNEGRSALRFSEKLYLQTFYPSLSECDPKSASVSISRFARLLSPLAAQYDHGNRISVLLVLHAIDMEIKFGGLSAFYRLVNAIDDKFDPEYIDIVLTDQPGELPGACYQLSKAQHPLHRLSNKIRFHCVNESASIRSGYSIGGGPSIRETTIAIAYNAKAAFILDGYRKALSHIDFKWIYLIQEDESTFFGGSSIAALVRHSYALEHIPIYNSKLLRKYMELSYPILRSRSSTYFAHQYILPEKQVLSKHKKKILTCYLRPEKHAERNCAELIIAALEHCLRNYPDLAEWEIYGVGSLREHTIQIGPSVVVQCIPKMNYMEYSQLLRKTSVGISLMDAPHPSVVPFEMAGHGVITITNTHTNRSREDILNMSPSGLIVPCDLSIDSISKSLLSAICQFLESIESEREERVLAEPSTEKLSARWSRELSKVLDFIRQNYKI